MGDNWIFAIEEEKLEENRPNFAYPKGLAVMLVKKEGRIYAIANKCAHMACPLGGGALEGYTIKCPCHDWKFDIRTGEFLSAKELSIPVFQTKVSEGKVFVDIGNRMEK